MAIDFVSGQRPTPADLNALVPKYLELGSDQALTTTAAAWGAGALTIGANEKWVCELHLDYGGMSSAANDFRFSTSTLTGTVVLGRFFTIGAASGAAPAGGDGGFQSRDNSAGTISFGGTTGTGATRAGLAVYFTLTGGVSGGTFTPRINLSAGTGTLYAGSYLIAHRVS